MALTAYCKKCGREVEPAEVCPRCGTRLGKTAIHAAWCLERKPVADWMCWNTVMRVLLPAVLAVLLLVLLSEFLSGGTAALEKLFLGAFPATLLILLTAVLLVVMLALVLQGRELMDYVVDSRGIHVTRYLPDPTPLKLVARLKSPALMREMNPGSDVVRIDAKDLAWRDVARVQLWPEKDYVLFYAPGWWMRAAVRCTPFTWEDTMDYIREKLGRKKAVHLPENLRVQAPPRRSTRRGTVLRRTPAPMEEQRTANGFSEEEPEYRRGEPEPGAGDAAEGTEPLAAAGGIPPAE